MGRRLARVYRTRSLRDRLAALIGRRRTSRKPAILGLPATLWLAVLWFGFADNALATRITETGNASEAIIAELGDRAVNATEAIVAAVSAAVQFASAVVAVVIDVIDVLSRLPALLIV